MPHQPVRWETDRQPAAARHDRRALRRDRQGSGDHADDQRLPRARPPDRRPRPAGRRAQLPSPNSIPRPTASPSGISTANSSPAASARPSAKARPKPVATLREILETLRQTYCGKIGCEYMNIQVPEQKRWLQQRMEPEANSWPLDRETRLRILRSLIAGRRVRALPALPLRRPEALRAGRRRDRAAPSWKRLLERAADTQRARDRHRHGASRPPEHPGQHRSARTSSRSSPSSKAKSIPPARRARAT